MATVTEPTGVSRKRRIHLRPRAPGRIGRIILPVQGDIVERGLDLYAAVASTLHGKGGSAWLQVEISLAQLRALFALADGGPMPIGRVASRLSIGLPAASSLVDRLVEQDLAARQEDPVDRRRTLARPTPAGEALVQRLRQGSREELRSWLERMRRDDLEALVRGLAALADARAAVVGPGGVPVGEPASG